MPPRKNTKETLIVAMMRLVAQKGLEAATISAVAQEAGITQGAIYRHYRSKEALQWSAYKQTIKAMIREKEALVQAELPIREKLQQWIRLTYECFDRDPHAFTYVLLTSHPQLEALDDRGITTRQGKLLTQLLRQASQAKEIRDISPELAMSHVTGLMLNIPRLINENVLKEPAFFYSNDVADAVWQVLRTRHNKTKETDSEEVKHVIKTIR